MKTIEELAKMNATFIGNQTPNDAYIEGAKAAIELVENFIKERVLWVAMVPHIFSSACYAAKGDEFLNELLKEINGESK